jgi:DNA-binding transcriptional MerR regulator
MEKSPEAFRTIREVADAMDLPQHVLRFWETRFPQIRPLKRAGGRRYYRPDDIERLRLIKRLLYDEGYTIKGVQKLFKEQGVQPLAGPPSYDARRSLELADRAEPVENPPDSSAPGAGQPAVRGDRTSAPRPGASDLAPKLADEALKALRDVLAHISEAERILAQARSQGS